MHYKLQIESIFILAELSQHTSYELRGHPSHDDTIGGINDKILLKQTKCFIIPVKWAIVEVSGGDTLHICPRCKWPVAGRVRYIIGGDVRSCQLRLGEPRSLARGNYETRAVWQDQSAIRWPIHQLPPWRLLQNTLPLKICPGHLHHHQFLFLVIADCIVNSYPKWKYYWVFDNNNPVADIVLCPTTNYFETFCDFWSNWRALENATNSVMCSSKSY